jgi:2-hydroxycyclohexanecarboxyl-CoA dehydrogenase
VSRSIAKTDGVSRVAVVTGDASGLGLSVCQHLARQGCRVGVLDVDAEATEKAAADLPADGAAAIAVGVDGSDQAAVNASFKTVRGTLGPVQILVTSAAVAGFTRFEKITLDDWNRFMAVNLTGTFLSVQTAIPTTTARIPQSRLRPGGSPARLWQPDGGLTPRPRPAPSR